MSLGKQIRGPLEGETPHEARPRGPQGDNDGRANVKELLFLLVNALDQPGSVQFLGQQQKLNAVPHALVSSPFPAGIQMGINGLTLKSERRRSAIEASVFTGFERMDLI